MAKDLLAGNKPYWEDDTEEPVDLFATIKPEAPLTDRLKSGIKQAFAGVGNTADAAAFLPSAGIASLAGLDPTPLFETMTQREKLRNEWAGKTDPGFVGKLAGMATTLPMQILTMPVAGVETAKQFIEQGETIPRALGAGAIDTAANIAGVALPGVVQGGKAVRALSGGAINAAQDTASRLAISSIAETQGAKDLFAPSWETAALAAVPGAGLGVLAGKKSTKKYPQA